MWMGRLIKVLIAGYMASMVISLVSDLAAATLFILVLLTSPILVHRYLGVMRTATIYVLLGASIALLIEVPPAMVIILLLIYFFRREVIILWRLLTLGG